MPHTRTVEILTRPAGTEETFTSWLAVGPLEEHDALGLARELAKVMRHLHPDRQYALFRAGERLEG